MTWTLVLSYTPCDDGLAGVKLELDWHAKGYQRAANMYKNETWSYLRGGIDSGPGRQCLDSAAALLAFRALYPSRTLNRGKSLALNTGNMFFFLAANGGIDSLRRH